MARLLVDLEHLVPSLSYFQIDPPGGWAEYRQWMVIREPLVGEIVFRFPKSPAVGKGMMPSMGFFLPMGESSICIVPAIGVFRVGSVRDLVLERDRGLVGEGLKKALGLSRELGLIAQGLSFAFSLQRLRLERIFTLLGCFAVVGVPWRIGGFE